MVHPLIHPSQFGSTFTFAAQDSKIEILTYRSSAYALSFPRRKTEILRLRNGVARHCSAQDDGVGPRFVAGSLRAFVVRGKVEQGVANAGGNI